MRCLLNAAVCVCVALALQASCAQADVIYQFSTADASTPVNDDGYDPAVVSIAMHADVSGPADGTALAAGSNGLARFWNSEWAGFSLSSSNGGTIDSQAEFNTGFWTLTIAADPGYLLNLSSLTFKAAVGGSGDRGYQIYAAVDGGSFSFGDTPIYAITAETGTRSAARPVSVDLSDPMYQGIESISFRYYPLTPAGGNTIDFSGWTIEGTVVPEPSGIVLAAIALLGLALGACRLGGAHHA
jgi:hypothetical protein